MTALSMWYLSYLTLPKLKRSIEIVHGNSQHARNKMKQNYDKHNSHHQIQEGNTVML